MVLKKLYLDNFGKFHGKEIDLQPGINLVYGENETGKSTIHSFIQGMIFGLERLRGRGAGKDEYSKYQPWVSGKNYEGRLTFEHDGVNYRLVRTFYKEDEQFHLIDEDQKEEIELTDGRIDRLIEGLSLPNYQNSISIRQAGSRLDDRFAMDLQSYMANLGMTRNESVDITDSLDYLRKERRQISSRVPLDEMQELEKKIKELDKASEGRSKLETSIESMEGEEKKLIDEIERLKNEKDRLQKEDRKERMEAIRLVQDNNYLAEAYGKKKKQLQLMEASAGDDDEDMDDENQGVYYDDTSDDDLYDMQDALTEQLSGMRMRNLAILFPLVILLVLAFLSSTLFGLETVTRWLFVASAAIIIAIVLIVLRMSKARVHNRLMDVKTELKTREMGTTRGRRLVRNPKTAVKKSRKTENHELIKLREELAEIKAKYNAIQEPLKPYIEKFGNDIQIESNIGERQQAEIDRLREEKKELVRGKDKLVWQLEDMDTNAAYKVSLEEHLQEMKDDSKKHYSDIVAIDLAMNTLKELSEDIHESFGSDLNEEVAQVFGQITGESYGTLSVDNKLNISMDQGRKLISVDQLSAGTVDQLYFALRMAAGKLLFKGQEMPLILDDCFAFYDERRLMNLLKWLADNVKGQLIIFTCHERETRILEQLGLEYNYIELN